MLPKLFNHVEKTCVKKENKFKGGVVSVYIHLALKMASALAVKYFIAHNHKIKRPTLALVYWYHSKDQIYSKSTQSRLPHVKNIDFGTTTYTTIIITFCEWYIAYWY